VELMRWIRNQWDRSAALATVLAGAFALVAGYFGASSSTKPADQIPYIVSGAVLGLFLLGISATLWLSADLRDEWRKLHEIHDDLRR
jgi:hypothetical protein